MYAKKCATNGGVHKFKADVRHGSWQWFRCTGCSHVTARRAKVAS